MDTNPRPPENDAAQRLGRDLARGIVHALRTIRTHGPQNQVSTAAVTAMVQSMNRALQLEGSLELRIHDQTLHLGDLRMTPPPMEQRAVDLLVAELSGRGIGALRLLGPISPEEAWHLLRVLSRYEADDPMVYSKLVAELDQGHTVVSLAPLHRAPDAESESPASDAALPAFRFDWGDGTGASASGADPTAQRLRTTFAAAISTYEAALLATRRGDRIDLLRAKHVLRALLEAAESDEAALLRWAALRPTVNRAARHAVHTVIYSSGIGRRIGMTRASLMDLALGAFFHDLGAAALPPSLLEKTKGISPDDERLAREHPRLGARAILRNAGLTRTSYRAMLGALEHHLPFGEGTVKSETSAKPHLAARIIAVADAYDTLASNASFSRGPLTRQQSLALLLAQSGRPYDPEIVKCFVSMVGLYPIGCAVRLMSGQVGVVTKISEDATLCHRPTVLFAQGDQASSATHPLEMNLAAADPDGIFPDEIVAAFELDEPELAQLLA